MKEFKSTKVSVVMSVYNGEKYLKEAIDSILNQTFKDFEFIIINDGSTDNSLKIIKSYKDPRIVLISRKNKGLVASLNEGIKKARGEYIARQDADDISVKNRLYRQLGLLEKENKNAVFSFFEMIDDSNKVKNIFTSPIRNIDVYRSLFIRNPLGHGSVMFDKSLFNELGGYISAVGPVEDYDLWCRFFENKAEFGVVPEILYKWRDNPEGISSSKNKLQYTSALKIREHLIEKNNVPLRNPLSFSVNMLTDTRSIKDKAVRRRYSREQFLNQIELINLMTRNFKLLNLFLTFLCIVAMPHEIFLTTKESITLRLRSLLHKLRVLKNRTMSK
jgi:glycosyltransferase involved in cell wall biosynthesis